MLKKALPWLRNRLLRTKDVQAKGAPKNKIREYSCANGKIVWVLPNKDSNCRLNNTPKHVNINPPTIAITMAEDAIMQDLNT